MEDTLGPAGGDGTTRTASGCKAVKSLFPARERAVCCDTGRPGMEVDFWIRDLVAEVGDLEAGVVLRVGVIAPC